MKEKIVRKDLKRNELADSVGRSFEYVKSHRKGVVEAAAVAAGLVLVVVGFVVVKLYRERIAGSELSAGLEALQAPLVGEAAAATAPLTFPTDAARGQAADGHFRRAASHGGTAAGRAAAVILAARAEKPATAEETFRRAAREGKAEIAAAAEIDAAKLLASQGKTTEAVERLKRAIESVSVATPKDALLYTLAQIYETSGDSSDARATYQRLLSDYPDSPYRADARSRSGAGM
jgi:tetratricopeptide (TPR) repeat protein